MCYCISTIFYLPFWIPELIGRCAPSRNLTFTIIQVNISSILMQTEWNKMRIKTLSSRSFFYVCIFATTIRILFQYLESPCSCHPLRWRKLCSWVDVHTITKHDKHDCVGLRNLDCFTVLYLSWYRGSSYSCLSAYGDLLLRVPVPVRYLQNATEVVFSLQSSCTLFQSCSSRRFAVMYDIV